MSNPAKPADCVGDDLPPVVLVGHVEVGELGAATIGNDVVGDPLAGVVGDVAHDHGRPFFGKEAGFDLAHAACGSGNDGDFAFKPGHSNSPAGSVERTVRAGL